MIRKYIPIYAVSQLLRDKSKELRKYHCYSSWFYNDSENTITICTNCPGLWIGKAGKDVAELKDEINSIIDKYSARGMEHITIKFIDADC